MIIFNHTRIATTALKTVLYKAAKAVGSVRTGGVVVKIAQSLHSHGRAERSNPFYFRWALAGKEHKGHLLTSIDREPVLSDGGYIFIWLSNFCEPLRAAEDFYSTAAHEWRHIRDFQKGAKFGQYNRNWKNRPHERRAINSSKRAERTKNSRMDIQDAIITLGIAIEESRFNS